jgi:hypothetical protein
MNADSNDRPSTARRTLLTGGAIGLAAIAGSTLGRTPPALATGSNPTPDWINVTNYATIGAAISAIPSGGGVLYFPAGTYTIAGTMNLVMSSSQGPIYVVGDGRDATILKFTGSGACIHMYNSDFPTGGGFPGISAWGGGVLGLTIDGTGNTNAAYGLHVADGEEYQLDLKIQNFAVSGSIGLYLYNTVLWIGRMRAKVQLLNCDTAVMFDVAASSSGGTNFGYSEWDFDIFAYTSSLTGTVGNAQNGVVINDGAHPYNSVLQIKGEWELGNSGSTSAPVGTFLTVTGDGPDSGPPSQITNCELNIWTELNGTGGGAPQTISLGSSSNKIKGCHGFLVFINSSTQPAWYPAGGFTLGQDQFNFSGGVIGDTNLTPDSNQGNTTPFQLAGAPVLYAPGSAVESGSNLTLWVGNGDFFMQTLTGNATVGWGSGQTPQAGPQRKTIILTQSATSLYSVTWPHPGSPSLNSPTVLWAGGTAPTMTQHHSATDVYYLETYDGITWYGQANQNVS